MEGTLTTSDLTGSRAFKVSYGFTVGVERLGV